MKVDEQVTRILKTPGSQEERMEQLLPLIYGQLRDLAHAQLRGRPSETINTTALVHEAFLKLARPAEVSWEGRAHFFGAAARAMRQVLIDYARTNSRAKRGGGVKPVSIDDQLDVLSPERGDELLALDEALSRLESIDRRQGRVVECRYFGGLSVDQTAEVLGVSPTTVKREWRTAKVWLYDQLAGA